MKLNYIKHYEEYYWTENENDIIFDLTINIEEYVLKILSALNITHNKITHIADGGNGVAIDLNNNTVLKITTDKSEAFYAHKLIDIDSPNLVKVYDVKMVKSEFQYGVLYVIHMEKLSTNIHSICKIMIDYLHKQNPIIRKIENDILVQDDEVLNFFKDRILSLSDDNILLIYKKWLNVYNECSKYNLPFDDFHSKNVGLSNRNNKEFVFFDISSINEIRTIDLIKIPLITL